MGQSENQITFFNIILKRLHLACVFVHACTNHSVRVEVRGQFAGVRSLVLPCRSWGPHSGHQDWQAANGFYSLSHLSSPSTKSLLGFFCSKPSLSLHCSLLVSSRRPLAFAFPPHKHLQARVSTPLPPHPVCSNTDIAVTEEAY